MGPPSQARPVGSWANVDLAEPQQVGPRAPGRSPTRGVVRPEATPASGPKNSL